MSPDSPPAAVPAPDTPIAPAPTSPGLLELFGAFARMSLSGFGGVLVFARRSIVDQPMMMPLIRKRDLSGLLRLAAVFVAIGLLRLPLPAVLLVAIPLSIFITLVMRRRAAA
jgi:hypothetical protein